MTSRTRDFLDLGLDSIFPPRSSNVMEDGCGSKVGKASARPSFLPSHAHQREDLADGGNGNEGKRGHERGNRFPARLVHSLLHNEPKLHFFLGEWCHEFSMLSEVQPKLKNPKRLY